MGRVMSEYEWERICCMICVGAELVVCWYFKENVYCFSEAWWNFYVRLRCSCHSVPHNALRRQSVWMGSPLRSQEETLNPWTSNLQETFIDFVLGNYITSVGCVMEDQNCLRLLGDSINRFYHGMKVAFFFSSRTIWGISKPQCVESLLKLPKGGPHKWVT